MDPDVQRLREIEEQLTALQRESTALMDEYRAQLGVANRALIELVTNGAVIDTSESQIKADRAIKRWEEVEGQIGDLKDEAEALKARRLKSPQRG